MDHPANEEAHHQQLEAVMWTEAANDQRCHGTTDSVCAPAHNKNTFQNHSISSFRIDQLIYWVKLQRKTTLLFSTIMHNQTEIMNKNSKIKYNIIKITVTKALLLSSYTNGCETTSTNKFSQFKIII